MTNREHVLGLLAGFRWPHVELLERCWKRGADPQTDLAYWLSTYRLYSGFTTSHGRP